MLFLLVFLSASVWATPWFNITDAYIKQLDHDTYQIRVFVDFGGTNFVTPLGTESVGDFFHFTFGPLLGTSQYNPTAFTGSSFSSYLPGDYREYFVGGMPSSMDTYDGGFGYDFDVSEPFADPFVDISYAANFYGGTRSDEVPIIASFSGTFSAAVVPEPGTLLLVGLGLTGLGLIRRKKS